MLTYLEKTLRQSKCICLVLKLKLMTCLLAGLFVTYIVQYSCIFETLMNKMAKLDLPAVVYNWLAAFFTGHEHCTIIILWRGVFYEVDNG